MDLGRVSNALMALTPTCTVNIHLRPEKGGNTPAAGDESSSNSQCQHGVQRTPSEMQGTRTASKEGTARENAD